MITCSVCNTQNPDGTQYCEGCGVELTAAATSPTAPTIAEPVPVATAEATPVPEVPTNPSAPQEASIPASPEVPPQPQTFKSAKLTLKRFGALTSDLIPLNGPRLVLGRFDASTGPVDIDLSVLPGTENLSRRHAELFYEGGWKIRDLGSTNGVFIKRAGEDNFSPRIADPASLNTGDEVALGNVVFLFEEN